jgi:CRP-like cAMP-binding protein
MKPITKDAFESKIQPLNRSGRVVRKIEDLFEGVPTSMRVPRGQSIVIRGDRVEHLYQIVAGTVRCCSFSEEGRRQIFHFARAGHLLGFVDPDHWRFSAEAVDCVVLRSIPVTRLESALDGNAELSRDLRNHVAAVLAERERQLSVLAFEPATQRLLWFLKDLAGKRAGNGFLPIPMTRQEIGDFLGLSLETVSRSFGTLRMSDIIEMKGADRFRLIKASATMAA